VTAGGFRCAALRFASCCYQGGRVAADYRGEFGAENRVKVPTISGGTPLLAVISGPRGRRNSFPGGAAQSSSRRQP
jgi:hypothetical protein